ncbi:galactokinase [Jatrophihabitans endophyticus]|uniref:galactokinase n=1 Tax=Jatrophihabitans endophyticus TaxID=1206085 RepID=UPI001A04C943|nr:galactokinase [Jatrophihabitans endophyticus]MBE7188557.1 galactokinase [Jatrophihabitans endophyticus]
MPRTNSRGSARWSAPGRVNLIGEHTDYNEGFALPLALTQSCTATVELRPGSDVRARSVQRDAELTVAAADLHPGTADWAGYVLGVAWVLRGRGHDVPGLSIEVDSTVPVGAGLSSSAALVCSTAAAVDDLLGLHLGPDDVLAVTRSVENDFVGAPTGGMDQLAALRCTAGNVLFCDMRSLATEQVPFDLAAAGLTLLVLDTRAEHRHADGEYGARRAGCTEAAGLLGVPALRDVTADHLDDALTRLPDDTLRRYVRHIVTEDDRVLRTVETLRTSGPAAIGDLLTASHASMRDDFRITVAEVDVAVDTLLAAGALGARMTGGGFGGCVIALLPPDGVDDAVDAVRSAYSARGFTAPAAFCVPTPAAGAHPLPAEATS